MAWPNLEHLVASPDVERRHNVADHLLIGQEMLAERLLRPDALGSSHLVMMPSMPLTPADRLLQDCRGAVGQVRFGFGSKRQVWAFEERHQLDAAGSAEELAREDPGAFLDMALAFHDEFTAVSNSWRVRDRIQALAADLLGRGDGELLARATHALVDGQLAVRHWLLAAFVAGPPLAVFRGLQEALGRAYLPQDHWALLARLRTLAEAHGWTFGADAARVLAELAQFSARPEDRRVALDLLARFGGPAATACLARAARGDADPEVRAKASELLGSCADGESG